MIRTALITVVAAAALSVSAGAVWFAGAGTALAPEPAQLTQALGTTTGESAAARFVNTNVETSVVKWPSSWTANTTLAAGRLCSATALYPGELATRTIQANGNYRKCA